MFFKPPAVLEARKAVIILFSLKNQFVFLLLWIAVQKDDSADRVEIFTEASDHALQQVSVGKLDPITVELQYSRNCRNPQLDNMSPNSKYTWCPPVRNSVPLLEIYVVYPSEKWCPPG